ncbi:hypothetical protein RchiOBHm_Chr5g0061581 [Rosa chinensis]|uniref:Uncharacterized protein n=1 Tax=Rosa chinensis TaxID=74649 RepID=A0A2P6QI00_ROSCH|nr:hypothetical protein RchiOBHm_Chr5g0061581 [Rosa chinensis]
MQACIMMFLGLRKLGCFVSLFSSMPQGLFFFSFLGRVFTWAWVTIFLLVVVGVGPFLWARWVVDLGRGRSLVSRAGSGLLSQRSLMSATARLGQMLAGQGTRWRKMNWIGRRTRDASLSD